MDKNVKIILHNLTKFFMYSAITAVCMLIMLGAVYLDISTMGRIPDSSLTEGLQETLLFLSSLIFSYLAVRYRSRGLWLVAGLLCCMFIREWDSLLDNIFHGAWKYFALLAALIFIYLALKEGYKNTAAGLVEFMQRKSYLLMLISFIELLVISRMMGMRVILKLITGSYFNSVWINFLEEGLELLGYMGIFISALCYLWEYRKANK